MSDYFHESMVTKMVSSNGYQQGYSVGFASGYKQGREKAIDEVITLARAEIDFESQAEQKRFVEFMEELKEQKNNGK